MENKPSNPPTLKDNRKILIVFFVLLIISIVFGMPYYIILFFALGFLLSLKQLKEKPKDSQDVPTLKPLEEMVKEIRGEDTPTSPPEEKKEISEEYVPKVEVLEEKEESPPPLLEEVQEETKEAQVELPQKEKEPALETSTFEPFKEVISSPQVTKIHEVKESDYLAPQRQATALYNLANLYKDDPIKYAIVLSTIFEKPQERWKNLEQYLF